MPKRTGDFDAWLLNELTDPQLAAEYVNAAIREDPDLLPVVLREVAKAHTMKKVAEEAGVARESLYTSLSEVGNPTLTNLNGILKAVGLKIEVVPDSEKSSVQEPSPGIAVVDNPPKDNVCSGHLLSSNSSCSARNDNQ
jgi:probable addiction module antidote protein